MSEVENTENESQNNGMTEIQMLKQRADAMGIAYSNNISVDTLRKRIDDKMNGIGEESETVSTSAANPLADANAPVTESLTAPMSASLKKKNLRQHLIAEATKLIRVRITCMDPKKADLQGEVFTVANEFIGTIRKYIPFTPEATENGFHVPYALYEMLKARQFLLVKSTTHPITKQVVVTQRWVREFAIEVLEPLTKAELAELAAAQTASNRLQGD